MINNLSNGSTTSTTKTSIIYTTHSYDEPIIINEDTTHIPKAKSRLLF